MKFSTLKKLGIVVILMMVPFLLLACGDGEDEGSEDQKEAPASTSTESPQADSLATTEAPETIMIDLPETFLKTITRDGVDYRLSMSHPAGWVADDSYVLAFILANNQDTLSALEAEETVFAEGQISFNVFFAPPFELGASLDTAIAEILASAAEADSSIAQMDTPETRQINSREARMLTFTDKQGNEGVLYLIEAREGVIRITIGTDDYAANQDLIQAMVESLAVSAGSE